MGPTPSIRCQPDESIHSGPLTFDPLPPSAVDEKVALAAADNQAKLMQWYYCLCHLFFHKLKQLTINGKIPKKLSKLKPPSVCWLTIWCDDQATLAWQIVGTFS
jgi:hypothetical protein